MKRILRGAGLGLWCLTTWPTIGLPSIIYLLIVMCKYLIKGEIKWSDVREAFKAGLVLGKYNWKCWTVWVNTGEFNLL